MHRSVFVPFLCAAVLAAYGCSADAPAQDRSGASAGSAAATGQTAGSACSLDNLTQACSCAAGLSGRQTCAAGAWSACSCRAPTGAGPAQAAAGSGGIVPPGTSTVSNVDPPENHSATRFDWLRTMPTGGSCEAGHYEGTFSGWYGPSIIVVSGLKVIPVFPIDLPGSPGLAFDLNREGSGEIFTVANGKMNGNALGAFPFTADIVGKLDCTTAKFDAKLVNGTYNIGPLAYNFEGPIIADYDKQTHTLTNGTWMVTEPAYPSAGGMGDWTVQWLHN
jgi:hypothetical protein